MTVNLSKTVVSRTSVVFLRPFTASKHGILLSLGTLLGIQLARPVPKPLYLVNEGCAKTFAAYPDFDAPRNSHTNSKDGGNFWSD